MDERSRLQNNDRRLNMKVELYVTMYGDQTYKRSFEVNSSLRDFSEVIDAFIASKIDSKWEKVDTPKPVF